LIPALKSAQARFDLIFLQHVRHIGTLVNDSEQLFKVSSHASATVCRTRFEG
jgi:hypothetical protein